MAPAPIGSVGVAANGGFAERMRSQSAAGAMAAGVGPEIGVVPVRNGGYPGAQGSRHGDGKRQKRRGRKCIACRRLRDAHAHSEMGRRYGKSPTARGEVRRYQRGVFRATRDAPVAGRGIACACATAQRPFTFQSGSMVDSLAIWSASRPAITSALQVRSAINGVSK